MAGERVPAQSPHVKYAHRSCPWVRSCPWLVSLAAGSPPTQVRSHYAQLVSGPTEIGAQVLPRVVRLPPRFVHIMPSS